MGIFVYAFSATGKTTVAKKYSNVIDMESTLYKYDNVIEEDETLKCTKREKRKDWPENYFRLLEEVKNQYDYILISDNICNTFLREKQYEYWWVYPKKELKEEYLQRCQERGNNPEFLYWYDKEWDDLLEACRRDDSASKHIELDEKQYLEDVLPNLKN